MNEKPPGPTPGSTPARPVGALPDEPRRSQRLKRIRDYQQEALGNPDALQANLAAINGDLMRIAYRLMKATDQALGRCPRPLEDLPGLLPAIETCSQLARQIDRLAQLDVRLRAAQGNKCAPGSRG
jgi:hypothetical protein